MAKVQPIDPVSAAFDVPSEDDPTYNTIASRIVALKPRALTPVQVPDIIIMVEYMRDVAIEKHDANIVFKKALDQREKDLVKREHDVAIKFLAVEAALRTRGPKKWWK